jgi:hypothetical protein
LIEALPGDPNGGLCVWSISGNPVEILTFSPGHSRPRSQTDGVQGTLWVHLTSDCHRLGAGASVNHISHVEKPGALETYLDEGRLHPRHYSYYSPLIDIADNAAVSGALYIE